MEREREGKRDGERREREGKREKRGKRLILNMFDHVWLCPCRFISVPK